MIQLDLTRRLALVAALAVTAFPATAQEGEKPAESKEKSEESKDGEKKKEEVEHWFAIQNGDVYTGTGEVLRGATLLAKNGKIHSIGYDLYIPPDTKTVDAKGYRLYPGLVAISSQGLLGNSSGDFDDTIDPFNYRMVLGLATGITTTGAGSGAVKLKRFSVDGAVVNEKIFSSFSWSNSNPRGKGELHEKLVAAANFQREYREWQRKVKDDKTLVEPTKRGVDNTVLAVLQGEQTAKFVANDRDELLGIARLAQEFNFRPVIEGCQEGWTIADELGRAGVRAIVTPRDRRPKDERQALAGGASIENAAILHKAGVAIAITPATEGVDLGGLVGRDIMHLPLEPGFAVRGGLSERAALESITIVPARILGIAHRVGSLEVGKDCDVIITDGDVLHYKTFVQWAVVDGKVVYDKEKELFFAHIRPRPEAPAPKKVDAGETPPNPDAKPADAEKEGEKKEEGGDDAKKKGEGDEKKKDG
ncbi:MAG: amidohydrolase family protein [Planctomycetota bacterium]|nr:amidohydrolase family protein [Planctomycetota bacterium]